MKELDIKVEDVKDSYSDTTSLVVNSVFEARPLPNEFDRTKLIIQALSGMDDWQTILRTKRTEILPLEIDRVPVLREFEDQLSGRYRWLGHLTTQGNKTVSWHVDSPSSDKKPSPLFDELPSMNRVTYGCVFSLRGGQIEPTEEGGTYVGGYDVLDLDRVSGSLYKKLSPKTVAIGSGELLRFHSATTIHSRPLLNLGSDTKQFRLFVSGTKSA